MRAVLADRPAEEAAVLAALERVLGLAVGRNGIAGDHGLVAVHEEDSAVQVVPSGPREDADHAAARAAVFGLEAVDEDLELLDGVEVGPLLADSGDLVAVVHAVHAVAVGPAMDAADVLADRADVDARASLTREKKSRPMSGRISICSRVTSV